MNLPKQNHISSASPGVSLIIAMILITILVLFSAGVTEVIVGANRNAVNILRSTQAYYAAESGLEEALAANSKLKSLETSIGAEQSGNKVDGQTSYQWKISGTAASFPEKTVNGKYIIPLPWTGNAPWHGEGSIPSSGGCDPQKLPTKTADGHVELKGPNADLGLSDTQKLYFEEQYHPCNWSTLRTGEKVSLPLYSVASGSTTNFKNFTLRLRTPCSDGREMCNDNQRMELNCWDRGTSGSELRCTSAGGGAGNNYRGEILVLWQIDAQDSEGDISSLGPYYASNGNKYLLNDTDLYEGKINQARKVSALYQVLGSASLGKNLIGENNIPVTIEDFLKDSNYTKPVLSLTLISDLIGCQSGKTSCTDQSDNPQNVIAPNNTYKGPLKIPYLEYQLVLDDATDTNLPAGNENVITAEGQSGQFVRTIQVRVPNNNTGLEYVIQQ